MRPLIGFVAGVLTLVAPPSAASADVGDAASTRASCMGVEAAAVSPPGSSSEVAGGMPGLKAFVEEVAPGVPPGMAFFSVAARLHAGSHEACDDALE